VVMCEDGLAAVAAIHHRINCPGVLDSQFPRHSAVTTWPSNNCQLSGPL
jgi:hypothetical protein